MRLRRCRRRYGRSAVFEQRNIPAKPEPGGELQTARWQEDPGAAFYVATYLRAAEHAIRLNCPMFYT